MPPQDSYMHNNLDRPFSEFMISTCSVVATLALGALQPRYFLRRALSSSFSPNLPWILALVIPYCPGRVNLQVLSPHLIPVRQSHASPSSPFVVPALKSCEEESSSSTCGQGCVGTSLRACGRPWLQKCE